MDYQDITFSVEDGSIGVITLNRPETRNALTQTMRAEIRHAVKHAPSAGARVLVFTGAGDGFCSGQDLGHAENVAEIDLGGLLREEYEPMLREIYDCPIPTLAAVNGAAAGAGANLALATDIVIAKDGAVFLQAFTKIGLIPDAGGTYFLPRGIGLPRAMGAALLAEPIPAKKAAEWGMIWEAVAKSKFEARVKEITEKLASGPSEGYRMTKIAMRASLENSLEDQLALEAELQGEACKTRDFKEGLFAFMENRVPNFEGR
ncbi:MAG: enoyl-CoA hydratase-related protein [Pseudomonadota bacterium]